MTKDRIQWLVVELTQHDQLAKRIYLFMIKLTKQSSDLELIY